MLSRPWSDVVLSGATMVEQFRSNLAALAVPWDDAVGERLGAFAETPDDDSAKRSRMPWN